ncbi:tRNA (adenosine(37)-N6)-threonylcarbamoyltransferase complex dimerization subunit type 1 TsaB [Bifidobacterium vansinderenii]|uniref:tRNA threonylcarbamoyladenosine biosynthesis protein TsaB n=1 Tax=Bifidobacterium vansinderenii TaxID=1984871 RepID=A0A229VXZ5_9BIFI|nr:tRNA (adenosine(37)-N6)-threonylcarbamoyltransferase complex dimerization subunit type 1 TsaB [Bifidobacterium vansinderenii]OXN00472.1 tRNA threonylcarbamoyladenosine biosynthesis protein TsaB [Bifidobacterium vansinderenii]
MGCTLVIDTSYGSTVGVVGHEPIIETDSRTHVEKLQGNIARAIEQSGNTPQDIDTIIVGTGPAPFTGLRAGIVTAKALAFATGATLIGQNILEPQARWNLVRRAENGTSDAEDATRVLTLAVNDARRKQLYFELCEVSSGASGADHDDAVIVPLIAMDIDYPSSIVERVNQAVTEYAAAHGIDPATIVVDVVGHGAGKYASTLQGIERLGDIVDESVLDQPDDWSIFAAQAVVGHASDPDAPIEPLYLRRPDAEVPSPLKHVLNHAGAERTA